MLSFRFSLFFALAAVLTGPAHSAERIALLIGNQAYNAQVGPLKNPTTTLRSLPLRSDS